MLTQQLLSPSPSAVPLPARSLPADGTATSRVDALPSTTDVLIVGGGPTGLALANLLAREGVDFVVVDKLAQGQNTSRAAVIHAHTLEMLDDIGAAQRLAAHAIQLTRFRINDRDRLLLRLRFDDLPTRHPYLLMIPQDVTERVLAEQLADAGGTLHRGFRVAALRQEAERVVARVVADDGSEKTIRARYAVGADGMHSVVREAAGIGFAGSTYGHSFILADVRLTWGHGREDVQLFFSPAGLVVVAPLPDGSFRIVATVEQAPEQPDLADIQRLLDERGPVAGQAVVTQVNWSSRFRVHHRLARRYRNGRLLLMGDAAHVHSPAGGQGMNTGLVDATVLGRILAAVLRNPEQEPLLDEFERLRRPAASHVLQLADRLTRAATLNGKRRRRLRNFILSLAGRLAPLRRKLALNLSGLSRRGAVWPPPKDGSRPT